MEKRDGGRGTAETLHEMNKQTGEKRRDETRRHAYISELISAHCLSDMCDARDSMMSNSSGWLSDRRLGSLDTFRGRRAEQKTNKPTVNETTQAKNKQIKLSRIFKKIIINKK